MSSHCGAEVVLERVPGGLILISCPSCGMADYVPQTVGVSA